MKEWLVVATGYSIVVINGLALIIIVVGTVETFFGGLRAMFSSPDGHTRRDVGSATPAGWSPASRFNSRRIFSRRP